MKNNNDCIYCGGEVLERLERLDYRHHGQLFIIENVPLGVCIQCGEKFLSADVSKKLEKAVTSTDKNFKMIAIPVISLAA